MSVTLPQPAPATAIRPGHEYSKLAFGYDQQANLIQVLGLQSGKSAGQPAVASVQKPGGGWTPTYQALTPAVAPSFLTDLVVSTGHDVTEAVGLDNNGYLYLAGSQQGGNAWVPGRGRFAASPAYAAGSLSAQLINTSTIFALTRTGAPCVAVYRDQGSPAQWQPGYALPLPAGVGPTFSWLGARPEVSDAGITRAIGLTSGGQACEVACASGPGTGAANWKAGKGILGSGGLPFFTQLLLVSGDAASTFHVIGLGQDGSIWDIDQYAAQAASPAWSGKSVKIANASPSIGPRIGFYIANSLVNPGHLLVNLVAWGGITPVIFAQYGVAWSATNIAIPCAGVTDRWYLVNDLTSTTVHLLGLSLVGNVHTVAACVNGLWSAGSQAPING